MKKKSIIAIVILLVAIIAVIIGYKMYNGNKKEVSLYEKQNGEYIEIELTRKEKDKIYKYYEATNQEQEIMTEVQLGDTYKLVFEDGIILYFDPKTEYVNIEVAPNFAYPLMPAEGFRGYVMLISNKITGK